MDERAGREIAAIELRGPTNTALMTFVHEGKQYIVVAIGSGQHPGSLVALRLPGAARAPRSGEPGS
ncbi:MAG TPA: hypothetical protein VF192_10810 [Longimicrobiales bacterium]